MLLFAVWFNPVLYLSFLFCDDFRVRPLPPQRHLNTEITRAPLINRCHCGAHTSASLLGDRQSLSKPQWPFNVWTALCYYPSSEKQHRLSSLTTGCLVVHIFGHLASVPEKKCDSFTAAFCKQRMKCAYLVSLVRKHGAD